MSLKVLGEAEDFQEMRILQYWQFYQNWHWYFHIIRSTENCTEAFSQEDSMFSLYTWLTFGRAEAEHRGTQRLTTMRCECHPSHPLGCAHS